MRYESILPDAPTHPHTHKELKKSTWIRLSLQRGEFHFIGLISNAEDLLHNLHEACLFFPEFYISKNTQENERVGLVALLIKQEWLA